jgi:ribonuclease HI
MSKFYAVKKGREPGIFRSWEECKRQVNQYPGAVYKSFKTLPEAEEFNKVRYKRKLTSRSHDDRGGPPTKHSCVSDGAGVPVVYADGCCYGNGRVGAKAGMGVYWDDHHPHNMSRKLTGKQTNQRAELVSSCLAIESAMVQGHDKIELRTDSNYTIRVATKWTDKWEQNGWKTSEGGDVLNKDDIMRLRDLTKKVDVTWTHVRGHQGIHGNEMADQLAKLGASK